MNCQQVEKFLPLYAGREVSAGRAQSIARHLEQCASCTEAAADYQDARELMRAVEVPSFADDFYADIRRSVWREIEGETRPSLLAWFQPGFAWIAAAALLVTFTFAGMYFVAKSLTPRADNVASIPPAVMRPGKPLSNTPANSYSHPDKKPEPPRQLNMPERERRPGRAVSPDRPNPTVAYSRDIQVTPIESSSPIIGTDNSDLDSGSSSKTLRMELQTRDPNIRIIWFTQSEPKPVPHSKGI
jgi:Putative zinc-finger